MVRDSICMILAFISGALTLFGCLMMSEVETTPSLAPGYHYLPLEMTTWIDDKRGLIITHPRVVANDN